MTTRASSSVKSVTAASSRIMPSPSTSPRLRPTRCRTLLCLPPCLPLCLLSPPLPVAAVFLSGQQGAQGGELLSAWQVLPAMCACHVLPVWRAIGGVRKCTRSAAAPWSCKQLKPCIVTRFLPAVRLCLPPPPPHHICVAPRTKRTSSRRRDGSRRALEQPRGRRRLTRRRMVLPVVLPVVPLRRGLVARRRRGRVYGTRCSDR